MGIEVAGIRNVATHYGPRETTKRYGGEFSHDGTVREIDYVFKYNELPTYGSNNIQIVIPAYAKIISAQFEVLEGFTSTSTLTDLDVGLYTSAGVAIDADGLLTQVQLTQTVIATRGNFVTGTGALVGASIGANAGEVVVTPNTNDLTAGKARLIIKFINEGV